MLAGGFTPRQHPKIIFFHSRGGYCVASPPDKPPSAASAPLAEAASSSHLPYRRHEALMQSAEGTFPIFGGQWVVYKCFHMVRKAFKAKSQNALAKVITETRDHLDGGLANAGKRTGNRE
jgi:hypothetical protein